MCARGAWGRDAMRCEQRDTGDDSRMRCCGSIHIQKKEEKKSDSYQWASTAGYFLIGNFREIFFLFVEIEIDFDRFEISVRSGRIYSRRQATIYMKGTRAPATSWFH